MNTGAIGAVRPATMEAPVACFPEWAVRQVDRLVHARALATTTAERADLDLQIAAIYDTARRYGSSLVDASEL
ncbi:MAG TPA: hypothetical protein VK689_03840 [Armatimonadota bacterium]|nr:hypothetical protein [Armatimonadota bacterium]